MEYEELCKEIQSQIYNYQSCYILSPNSIILGIELYDLLKSSNELMIRKNGRGFITNKTIFGIDITIDYDNKNMIKVGYMKLYNKTKGDELNEKI